MPDKSPQPRIRILRDIASYEPRRIHELLTELICTTLADVHLADGGAEADVMQLSDGDRRGIVLVLYDRSYETDETDFTDAIMALLNHRAAHVYWYVVADTEENAVTVIGAYAADMPVEAVTPVT